MFRGVNTNWGITNRVIQLGRLSAMAATVALSLSGCGLLAAKPSTIGRKAAIRSQHHIAAMQQDYKSRVAHGEPPIEILNDTYIGQGKAIPISQAEKLPALFHQKVTLNSARPMELADVAGELSQMLGIPVVLSSRLQRARLSGESITTTGPIGDSTLPNLSRQRMTTGKGMIIPLAQVRYSGTVTGLLDSVAARYQVFWKYTDGQIRFFRLETHTFAVDAPVGSVAQNISISNNSDSSSSGSGSGASAGDSQTSTEQTTKATSNLSAWKDAVSAVKSMLSPNGSVVATQSSGTVTVTDVPPVIHQVADYLKQINAALSRQVAITVRVYNLTRTDDQHTGIDLTGVFTNIAKEYSLNLSGAQPLTTPDGIGSVSAMILDSASASSPRLGQFAGSQAILRALRQKGVASLLTSGSGIVMNNQPLPIQNVQRLSYLASSSVTTTTNAGTTAQLQAGVVTTGFSMTVTPHILADNRVLLRYTITLSNLEKLSEVTSGDQKIQVPEVNTRTFMQRTAIRPGSTLVLAGFQQVNNSNDQGRGLFGYQNDDKHDRSMVIITITVKAVGDAMGAVS